MMAITYIADMINAYWHWSVQSSLDPLRRKEYKGLTSLDPALNLFADLNVLVGYLVYACTFVLPIPISPVPALNSQLFP
jgi:hypothetical protein